MFALRINYLNCWWFLKLWAGEDSNLQGLLHTVLNRTRLPVPPPALLVWFVTIFIYCIVSFRKFVEKSKNQLIKG